jgi:hypothetical protein
MEQKNNTNEFKLVFWIFVVSTVITFFIAVKKYEHHTTLTSKRMVESEYRLERRKQSDIVLSYDEYFSLKMNHPDDVYISDPKYYFTIDGEEMEVDKKTYDDYGVGYKIKYECSLIINVNKIIVP